MRIIGYIFLIIIIVLGITFSTINATAVTVNYYLAQSTLPLSLLLVITLSIGCILGLLVCTWAIMKMKLKNYKLKQKLELAEKEIQNLRAIPLQDKH